MDILLEILKTQGIATLLLVVVCLIIWYWVLPEWRRQAQAKSEQEEKRQQAEEKRQEAEAAHRTELVNCLKEARLEHRQERKETAEAHREDSKQQYNTFGQLIDTLKSGLDTQTREIARNSALTVATAEALGANRASLLHRATELGCEHEPLITDIHHGK